MNNDKFWKMSTIVEFRLLERILLFGLDEQKDMHL